MQTKSDRLKALPPYLFAEIDRKKKAAVAAGRPVIHLGIGDPDTPTPDFIIKAAQAAVADPATHPYALDRGDLAFRKTIAAWHKKRFGVDARPGDRDPARAGLEGDALAPAAGHHEPRRCGPRARPRIPRVCLEHPVCRRQGRAVPDHGRRAATCRTSAALKAKDLKGAKLIYLNYPNNPTAALATLEFYAEVVAWARRARDRGGPGCGVQRDLLRRPAAEHPPGAGGQGRGGRVLLAAPRRST